MSRVIKFRAWYVERSHMIAADNLIFHEYTDVADQFTEEDLVFMQFTGLLDKNGVEIYESDVIEADGGHYVIEWRDAAFIRRTLFLLSGDGRKVFPIDPVYTLYESEGIERAGIIGNIHESPELLEVSQ